MWITLAISTAALLFTASSIAVAQNAPPTFQGDPDVYKVIFEDQNFRVIASTRKKGSTTSLTDIRFRRSFIS